MVLGQQLGLVCRSGCTEWFKGCSVFHIWTNQDWGNRTNSAEETFFTLRLAASFVLISFSHKWPFSCPFRGQVPNGSRGQWSWKRLQQCPFLLFLWSEASYWPPLSSFLIRKSPNGWKMASKRTSWSFSLSHQSQASRLSQVTWYLPGDDTLSPLLLNVLGQTRKLHRLELWGCTDVGLRHQDTFA